MGSSFLRCYSHLYTFFGIFSLCLILESISITFLIGSIQSIERQFQIPSKITGTLVSARDVGYCIFVIFLAYIGSKGNRAKWIGGGALVIAGACVLISSPHWIFPHVELQATEPIVRDLMKPPSSFFFPNLTKEELLRFSPIRANLLPGIEQKILGSTIRTENGRFRRQVEPPTDMMMLMTDFESGAVSENTFLEELRLLITKSPPEKVVKQLLKAAGGPVGNCNPIVNKLKEKFDAMKCAVKEPNNAAISFVFIGIMLIGAAHSLPGTLGLPLIDDNVKKNNAPLYFAGMFGIQFFGPVLGLLFSSATSRIYYTLESDSQITPQDPRWIGAWWLGFAIIGAAIVFPALLLFFFPAKAVLIPMSSKGTAKNRANDEPRKLQRVALVDKHKDESGNQKSLGEKIKGFGLALVAIFRAKVFVGILVGRLIDSLSVGFMYFFPKFLEDHYGLPQYKSNMVMAFMGVFGFTLGMGTGGLIMKRLKLEGRKAVLWVAVCSLISGLLFMVKITLGCHSVTNSIGQMGIQNDFNFTLGCNNECLCESVKLSPVCDRAGNPYFSPCAAGCRNMSSSFGPAPPEMSFSQCQCVNASLPGDRVVSRDFCQDDCTGPLIAYIAITVVSGIIHGLAVIPYVLILLRSVPPEHRSLAMGLKGFLTSLIGAFPSAIIFGALIDGACLIWNTDCAGKGACMVYDPTSLRYRLHGFVGALEFVSLFTNIYVWYHAKGLMLLDEKTIEENGKVRAKSVIENEMDVLELEEKTELSPVVNV